MTVGELIDKLREYEREREVFVTCEVDNELYDEPAASVYLQSGHVFIGTEN